MLFDKAKRHSLSLRKLAPFEHTDLQSHFPHHTNLHDPSLEVLEFNNCIVSRDGFLRLENGSMITDIAYQEHLPRGRKQLQEATQSPADITEIEEPVLLIGGHNNYYHWHINWMPRIFLADRFGDLRDIPALIHAQPAKYVQDSMQKFTGRQAQKSYTLTGSAIFLKKVFVPNMFLNPLHAPFALRGYSRPQRKADVTKRIYISRAKAPVRRVINEDNVRSLLKNYGFETVIAEDLSYAEQVHLFSQANYIIGAHGAGLTNILFCNPGITVVELFNDYFTKVYWSLAQAIGSERYFNLKGRDMVPPPGETDKVMIQKNSDFSVDLGELRELLDKTTTP